MGTRGRKSAAALAVAEQAQPVVHADAPYDLTDEQAEIWRATIAALPPDWIEQGAHPTLAAFCRTTTQLRRLGQLIHQAEGEADFDAATYIALVKAHNAASQVIKTLSTALRLTPQTRLRPETAARRAGISVGRKPWE
jgi:hypothetical protein